MRHPPPNAALPSGSGRRRRSRFQTIAVAADGLQAGRLFGVGFDLLPEEPDVAPKGAARRFAIVSPHFTDQVVLRHRFARKYKYIAAANDLPGCVGCGRCARACLAGISPVEVLNQFDKQRGTLAPKKVEKVLL